MDASWTFGQKFSPFLPKQIHLNLCTYDSLSARFYFSELRSSCIPPTLCPLASFASFCIPNIYFLIHKSLAPPYFCPRAQQERKKLPRRTGALPIRIHLASPHSPYLRSVRTSPSLTLLALPSPSHTCFRCERDKWPACPCAPGERQRQRQQSPRIREQKGDQGRKQGLGGSEGGREGGRDAAGPSGVIWTPTLAVARQQALRYRMHLIHLLCVMLADVADRRPIGEV